MCKQKGRTFCDELGEDSATWSREAPLPKPKWVEETLPAFAKAVELAYEGRIEQAKEMVDLSDDAKLRIWYHVHGQNTSTWRFREFGFDIPKISLALDIGYLRKLETPIFRRDNFRCRYCNSPIIPREVFKAMNLILGDKIVPLGPTTDTYSGFAVMFAGTLDHVFPRSLGGRTIASNLVTCCWSCNYGKWSYTVEQLGLDNPLKRAPTSESSWKGLTDIYKR